MNDTAFVIRLGQVCIGQRTFKCRRIPHNQNARIHWHEKSRWNQAWREEVYWAVRLMKRSLPKLPLEHAKLRITFFQIKTADQDNCYGSAKILVDALKVNGGAGVIVDDSPKHVEIEVGQTKVSHMKDEHVEIEVRP